jgi:hypothetical protein
MPGQSYTVSLTNAITDVAGNPLVAASWTVRTSRTVESTSPALTEVWDRDTNAGASGGSYHASQTAGSSARFTFTGTNVTLRGTRGAAGGYADVYLDGHKETTGPGLSFYHSPTQWQYPMWSRSGLPSAKHILEVRPLGTKPAGSSGSWVYIDAFQVGSTYFQENNGAVRESFRRVSTASASGGSYELATHASTGDTGIRPYYSLSFKGTDLSVYGVKSTASGTAAFYVDNALRATVNLNGTTTYHAKLFDSATLTNSVHTLRIDIVGTPAGTNSNVGIDSITLV